MEASLCENVAATDDVDMCEENVASDRECNSPDISQDNDENQSRRGEIQFARIKFDELYESIDEEERRLQDLEERRKKLESDMERLQEEIEREKLLFRQAIDAEIAKKNELDANSQPVTIDPLNINNEEIELKLKEYREAINESQKDSIQTFEDDEEIKKLKCNLATYKKFLGDTTKEKLTKQKRKAAAKIFQKHLEEVDLKCSEQIGKLATIQRSIENITAPSEANNSLSQDE